MGLQKLFDVLRGNEQSVNTSTFCIHTFCTCLFNTLAFHTHAFYSMLSTHKPSSTDCDVKAIACRSGLNDATLEQGINQQVPYAMLHFCHWQPAPATETFSTVASLSTSCSLFPVSSVSYQQYRQ